MKKNNSKSKSKSKTNSKIIQEEEKSPAPLNCAVCKFPISENQHILRCEKCQKIAHTSCYNSQLIDTGAKKTFLCDPCKYKKGAQTTICVECNQKASKQMLKVLGNSQNNFIHVQCGLLTNSIEVQYSKMAFFRKNQKQTKSGKADQSDPCLACGKSSSNYLIKCIQCPVAYHFRCYRDFLDNGQNLLAYKWLDKFEKFQFLLNYLFLKKKLTLKNIVDQPTKHKSNQIFVCDQHSENYTYCYCGSEQLTKTRTHSDYQCEQCHRWVHQVCSNLPPGSVQSLKCDGCVHKNIFKKQMKLNQILYQINLIQKSNTKLDQRSIRLLNAFPFKYSASLEKKINESIKQIQLFFIKRQLLKQAHEPIENDKKHKKIMQMLLIVAYGDRWKQFQTQINKKTEKSNNILNQILDLKIFKFSEQIQQRIKNTIIKDKQQDKKRVQIQNFKQQLILFIKKWKSFTGTKFQDNCFQLAFSIQNLQIKYINILQAFKDQNQKQQFITRFQKTLGKQIFGQLIIKNISTNTVKIILNKYTLIQAYITLNRDIEQQQYFKLFSSQNQTIPERQKQDYKQILKTIAQKSNNIKISYESIKKQLSFKAFVQKLKRNQNDSKINKKIKHQIFQKEVCMIAYPSANILCGIDAKFIQQNAIKKKLLRLCSQRDCKIREQSLRNVFRIQQYLKRKNNNLTRIQKQCIQNYLGKLQFLSNILKKGEALQQFLIVESNENNVQEDENREKLSIVFLKLFHILDNWDQKILPTQFVINQIYHRCVLRKVKFTNIAILQRLQLFIRALTKRFQDLLQEGKKISIPFLRKLMKVLEYLDIHKQFPSFEQLFIKVKKWSTVLTGQDQLIKISSLLQKPEKAINLIKIIDVKLNSASELGKVNLYTEANKLSLMRQWCRLTEKISLLSKSKPTINGVQTLKTLLDRAVYPSNIMSKKITELQVESRNLNKQVVKFLQKPKASQHFAFNDQLKFISNKMTLQQGIFIKQSLEKCNLDVYVQNQQLQNQIRQFQQLPINLCQQAQKKSLTELNLLRKKLIDSSFKTSKLQDYQYFLRKIYILRCLNFEPPVTRQQYFQLLAIGGVAAIQLESKTSQLLKTYEVIKKAQVQLSTQIIKRRNFNNLLSINEQKYKQMKQDLRFDPNQINKLQKARMNNLKVRQEYYHLRSKKSQMERYKQIQFQLSNSIFNNRDILNEILALRNDLNLLVRRVQEVISYNQQVPQLHSTENIFKRDRGMIDAYNNIKIKHPTLEKYEHDHRYYTRAEQYRQQMNMDMDTYRAYCDTCSRISEVACKIPQFLNVRSIQFMNMFPIIMNTGKPQYHMYQVLISEGLQLRRLQSQQKQRIFTMVIQVYQKIRELQNNNEISEQQVSQQDQNQPQLSEQEQDQDQEAGQNEDEDDQQDDIEQSDSVDIDDEDSQESSSPNFDNPKRNHENNHIVLDSD